MLAQERLEHGRRKVRACFGTGMTTRRDKLVRPLA